MILICYDGSPDSRAALEKAAELFGDTPATVLTVWQPFVEVIAHTPSGFGLAQGGLVDADQMDKTSRDSAEQQAAEGTEIARRAGLNAQPRSCAQVGSTAHAILEQADELDAAAIVMGSRGLTGMKSLLVGSVSHAVIQHADRAVVVVPSPDVATARHQHRHPDTAS